MLIKLAVIGNDINYKSTTIDWYINSNWNTKRKSLIDEKSITNYVWQLNYLFTKVVK